MSGVVIVTKFSIAWKGALPSKAWIDYRFDLLKRTALPSLRQQTVRDLVWVIRTAPEWYTYVTSLFQQVELPCGSIKVLPHQPGLGVKLEDLADIHPDHEGFFITVPLDSDDALSRQAIERIVGASANVNGPTLFNLPSGVQLNWTTGELFYLTFRPHFQGPFRAIKNIQRETMLRGWGHHHTVRERLPMMIEVPGLNWLQVIHGKNLSNRIEYKRLVGPLRQMASRVLGPKFSSVDVSPVPDDRRQALLAEFGLSPLYKTSSVTLNGTT